MPTGKRISDLLENPLFEGDEWYLIEKCGVAYKGAITAMTAYHKSMLNLGIADVSNLSTTLSGKAATSHTHSESDITGLSADLSGKAAVSHTHSAADVTGLSADLSGKAAVGHTHSISDVSNLASTPMSITAAWAFTTPAFTLSSLGSITGTAAINLANGCFFSATVAAAVTLSITGTLTGTSAKNLGLVLTNAGTKITWPASIKGPGGVAPTLTAAGTDLLTFVTLDNGASWLNMGQVLDAK
jgi:hypothetical protein